jgi:transcriptional regulator with XRE-family HTH domain
VVDIGQRIRSLREQRGLSQEQLARQSDMSLKSYGYIERNVVRDPHISSLSRIAAALGVPISTLLGEGSEVPLASAPAEGLVEQRSAETTRRIYTQPGYGKKEYAGEYVAAPATLRAYVGELEAEADRLREENTKLRETVNRQQEELEAVAQYRDTLP